MAFGDHEQSVQDAFPIELYKFEFGGTETRLTNSHQDETFSSQLYSATEISRTQPRVNDDEPGSQVEILLGVDESSANTFATQWIQAAPEVDRIKVTLFRFHTEAGGGSIVFWIGFVVSVNYVEEGNVVSLLCKSLDNRFTLQGPRKNWGTVCNHKHYGRECTLDADDFTEIGTVTVLDSTGVIYTVPGISAPTVRWEGGTMLKSSGFEKRMIVAQSGDTFTVQFPITEIKVGDLVSLVEGCAHDTVDCAAYPNTDPENPSNTNIENFGGTPFTPTKNPFTNNIEYL